MYEERNLYKYRERNKNRNKNETQRSRLNHFQPVFHLIRFQIVGKFLGNIVQEIESFPAAISLLGRLP